MLKILLQILFPLALITLVDWYFFQGIKSLSAAWSEEKKLLLARIYTGFTIGLMVVSLVLFFALYKQWVSRQISGLFFNLLLIVFASKLMGCLPLLMDDFFRLGKWIVAFFKKGTQLASNGDAISRSAFLNYTSLALAAVPFSTMVYGMVKTAYDYRIRRHRIVLPKLPEAFVGTKILQISDLHTGSFFNGKPLQEAVALIMEQQPDLILFTGDLVNERSSEVLPYIPILSQLKAPLGVFSVLGNHDYGDYVFWDNAEAKAANFKRLIEAHAEMGWDLLRNEYRLLTKDGQSIKLLGVENWGKSLRFPKLGDLNKAQENAPQTSVTLLMSHDPSHWEAQVLESHPEIDLTFSGHTHGFQFGVEIPGFKWSPSQYVYKQWAGLYESAHQKLYVNRGLGFLGYMGRVGIHPEITVVELAKNA